jgi:hypothetical protein
MKPWGDGPAPFDLTKSIACPVIGPLVQTAPAPGVRELRRGSGVVSAQRPTHRREARPAPHDARGTKRGSLRV